MKTCSKCNKEKSFTEFHKNKTAKDGHYSYCKTCKSMDNKRYRDKNKDKIASSKKEWYSKHRDEFNDKRRVKYQQNKDVLNLERKERDKLFRENNRDYLRDYHKTWRENNPDKVKEMRERCNTSEGHKKRVKRYKKSEKGRHTNYKALIKRRSYKHKVDFTPHERKEILDRDNWTCQMCNVTVHDDIRNDEHKANIDHIIPISKGGNSEPDNLQVLCRTCNLSKSNKILSKDFC